jgi:hypothetical protein
MHRVLHTVTLRMILIGAFCMCLPGLLTSALGQTNTEGDILPAGTVHNLAPVGGPVRWFFFFLAAALLVLVAGLAVLRYRVGSSLYKATSDVHWDSDAQADVGEQVDVTEVLGACAALVQAEQPVEAPAPPAKTELPQPHGRLFTPASGTAWGESMLNAFLKACMKVNCLARTWRESGARQVHSSNQPDPREAELIRRLMQRWQEFHVDPEIGVFLEHSCSAGKHRVCVISVRKDKHTLIQAGFNAGFVIESVGRYLKSTDLVYRRGPGDYHAPIDDELAKMTPGEKDSLIRISDIPDPWQAMIGTFNKGNERKGTPRSRFAGRP